MNDLTYLLYLDDDTLPLAHAMTLGNHLDNDLVVAGEDVSDFHIRFEVSERGPVAIPLASATVNVNGVETANPVQLIVGDTLSVGSQTMQIGFEVETAASVPVTGWLLVAADGTEYPLQGHVTLGRASSADIVVADEHVSRHHAKLVERDQYIWAQDLGSANGTRVNNQAIVGGVRLFHGDFLSLDRVAYQLVASGAELTPINRVDEPLRGTERSFDFNPAETTEFVTLDAVEETLSNDLEIAETGAFLLGVSPAVDGAVFRVGLGGSKIGRGAQCDIVISDSTVSAEHATITVRPEGITLTNLHATNGTKVNGEEIVSTEIQDGDVIRLGRVSLVFKDIPPAAVDQHPMLRRLRLWMLVGTVAAAILLALVA
ncbi:MAG: FHA domain-containing protein [Pseudomonadota bacterium]